MRFLLILPLALALVVPAPAQVEKGDNEVVVSFTVDRTAETLEYPGGDYEAEQNMTMITGSYGYFFTERDEAGAGLMMTRISFKGEDDESAIGLGFGYFTAFYRRYFMTSDPRSTWFLNGEIVKGFFLGWEDQFDTSAPSMLGVGFGAGAKRFLSEKTFLGFDSGVRVQSYDMDMGFGEASVVMTSLIIQFNFGLIL